MSTNRTSWIVAALVVAVVGLLVVRSLRNDKSTRATAVAPVNQTVASTADSSRGGDASEPHLAAGITPEEARVSSVIRAKRVLKERGFYDGPMDSHFDPTVAEALKKFQASVGMKPTGYLDEKTYDALGVPVRHRTK